MHDVVGVGFGPSNLALAVALHEQGHGLSVRFVERQARFGWHRGMLLDDARMQVSHFHDLATLRDPASRFGFLSYLGERGRLAEFVRYGTAFPTRAEFHDYLEWAAARFAHQVDYGTAVTSLAEVPGEPGLLDVHTSTGAALRTRAVVLATGAVPHLPDGVVPGPRVWHSDELLERVDTLSDPRRLVVVGAGQSAAEAAEYLHGRFPAAQVCAVFTRYGYSPADATAFSNGVFAPSGVDAFTLAPPEVRQMITGYHANTHRSVVDPGLIERLYRRHYHERVAGRERLRLHNLSRVAGVAPAPDGARGPGDGPLRVSVESLGDGRCEVLAADAVVYATGYRPGPPWALLGDLGAHCERDPEGLGVIGPDHRLRTGPGLRAAIHLQGPTEHVHGPSSTGLSTVAVRAGGIAAALARHAAGPGADPAPLADSTASA
ncbi:L-ornithine N5-oxygenase [Pseudonocardia sediminis]|uniref:L-lysine N6-monooxygenase MbtG n=1 Tax=Pseudonocardia sediminis TaxID=1397368 RepID=A0A4Q7UT76_PSEST|nr:SidA/IucD/PvdA family monooxygenase [Pseudonocardia sediminis]RZT85097.1 L-ornithine N5-oxygenase [Pseudonocardia sediminis]